MNEVNPCQCCGSTSFLDGDGRIGDVCTNCNWEVDPYLEDNGWSDANHDTLAGNRAKHGIFLTKK